MFFRLLRSALILADYPKYKSLGRTPPHLISTGEHGRNYFHAVGGGPPMVFISIIRVHSCNLFNPVVSVGVGKLQRSVQGSMIEGEWERFVGSVGMIIKNKEFRAPLNRDYLSFSTVFGDSGMLNLMYSLILLLIICNSSYVFSF